MPGLPKLVELAGQLGVQAVAFPELLLFDRRQKAELESQTFPVDAADRGLWKSTVEEMTRIGARHGLGIVDRTATQVPRSRQHLRWRASALEGTQTCPDPWSALFIRLDGSCGFCPSSELNIGNIHHDPFDEIWYGPRARRLFLERRVPDCIQICSRGLVAEPRHPTLELWSRRLRMRWRRLHPRGIVSGRRGAAYF